MSVDDTRPAQHRRTGEERGRQVGVPARRRYRPAHGQASSSPAHVRHPERLGHGTEPPAFDVQDGTHVERRNLTFGGYLEQWMESLPAAGLRWTTIASYERTLRQRVIPASER